MVTTTHNCDVCGKQFSESQRKQAEKHEAIPIREGKDFNNVVLKCAEEHPHYFLYRKTEKVDEAHERIYRRCMLCGLFDLKYSHGKDDLSLRDKDWEEYPVSRLEGRVREGIRLALTPEEMRMLKNFVTNAINCPDYLIAGSLRTI
ncbi:MAG TPA: hypothetical protein VMC80_03230 [Patescibacteria group bacterium]|nr:hypothetical protein [Patescibacteria group bacterium]